MNGVSEMDANYMKQIDLAIAIKTRQLQRCDLKSITEKHVRDTLFGTVWKSQRPKSVSKAIDDIFKISIGEIVGYLSYQAIVEGSMMNIEDIGQFI